MKRKSFVLLITLALIMTLVMPAAAAQVFVDNQKLDVSTVSESGTTLVPLRAIFQALGAAVDWDGSTQTVTATKDQTTVKLQIGSGTAYKNGQPVTLQVPGKVVSGNTMVPLRFVSESLGANVDWDSATQTITIVSVGTTTGSAPPSATTEVTKVHFIDVGQGDAIYIELPDNIDILIDAGDKDYGSQVVNYLNRQQVDDIEILIATHPHADHIGGLPAVFAAYEIEAVIDSWVSHDSQATKDYWAAVQAEGAEFQKAAGQAWTFGSCSFEVLGPSKSYQNLNDNSVVTKLTCPAATFLFTGDAEAEAEGAILHKNLDADILKVGHHGSSTSTSSSFLGKVNPEVAVISVGEGNSYSHPADETVQRLQNAGATIYRTDLQGTVIVTTDGKTYSVVTEKKVDPVSQEKQPVPVREPQPQPVPAPAQEPEPEPASATTGK